MSLAASLARGLALAALLLAAIARDARAQEPSGDSSTPSRLSVVIDACVGVDADAVKRIMALEEALVLGDTLDVGPDVFAEVDCTPDGHRLRVGVPGAGAPLERRLSLDAYPPAARPRLLALGLVELAAAVRAGGPAPAPDEPSSPAPPPLAVTPAPAAPQATLVATPPALPRPARWRLLAAWGIEETRGPVAAFVVPALALERSWSPILASSFHLEGSSFEHATAFGPIDVRRAFVGAAFAAGLGAGRLRVSAGAGLRGGALWVGGSPREPDVRGQSATRFVWGPFVTARVTVVLGSAWLLEAGLHAGAHARAVEARADREAVVSLGGTWLRPYVAVGWAF